MRDSHGPTTPPPPADAAAGAPAFGLPAFGEGRQGTVHALYLHAERGPVPRAGRDFDLRIAHPRVMTAPRRGCEQGANATAPARRGEYKRQASPASLTTRARAFEALTDGPGRRGP
jgi:hypothetical protein